MTTITLNGHPHAVLEKTSVAQLVAESTGRELGADGSPADGRRLGVAVVVDAAVLPRSRWHHAPVTEGQSIEIITAVQGG